MRTAIELLAVFVGCAMAGFFFMALIIGKRSDLTLRKLKQRVEKDRPR